MPLVSLALWLTLHARARASGCEPSLVRDAARLMDEYRRLEVAADHHVDVLGVSSAAIFRALLASAEAA